MLLGPAGACLLRDDSVHFCDRVGAAPQDVDASASAAPLAARSAEIPPGVSEASTHFWLNWPFWPDDGHVLEHAYLYGSARSGSSKLHSGADLAATLGTRSWRVWRARWCSGATIAAASPAGPGTTGNWCCSSSTWPIVRKTHGSPQGVTFSPSHVLYGHLNQVYVKTASRRNRRPCSSPASSGPDGPAFAPGDQGGSATFEATRNTGLWLQSRTGRGASAGCLTLAQLACDGTHPGVPGGRGRRLDGGRGYQRIRSSSLTTRGRKTSSSMAGQYVLVAGHGGKLAAHL